MPEKKTMELSIKDRNGKVAPFINGWNVCDLNPAEWTPNVQSAIRHAYAIGYEHAVRDCRNCLPTGVDESAQWPENKKEVVE